MGHSLASVINRSTYQEYKTRKRRKWGFIVLAAAGFLVLFYVLFFDTSLNAMGVGYYELTLPERILFIKQIFNPIGVGVCFLWMLILTFAAYHHATKSLHIFNDKKFQENDELIDDFGPAFISAGSQRIVVLKNYQGFLSILFPVFPSSKDYFFFGTAEKVDQIILLQEQSIRTDVTCRTRDGIPILFPNISLQYTFQTSKPVKNDSSLVDNKENPGRVKNYLLRKGNLSADSLVICSLTSTVSHILRKINLDDLEETNHHKPLTTTREADAHAGTMLKRYKVLSLKKHWEIIRLRKHMDAVHRSALKKDHPPRRSRNEIHRTPSGDHLFSTHVVTKTNDDITYHIDLESRIKQSLARELQKYHIELNSLQIHSWQPVEHGIQQKIQQAFNKSAALFSEEQKFDARIIQQQAKEEHLRFLIAQYDSAAPISQQERTLALQQLQKQAVQYGIPILSNSIVEDPEYNSQQNNVDPTQKG